MSRWGIKTRILALTLVPNILITFFLCGYFTYKRINDQNELIREIGKAFINQLSQSVEKEVISNNVGNLQLLANDALNQKDVRAVIIYNQNREPLVHAGPEMQPIPSSQNAHIFNDLISIYNTEDTLIFRSTISQLTSMAGQIPTAENGTYPEIGWIELEYTLVNLTLEKYQTFIASGSLFFLSVLLNLFFASRVSKDISDPILEITRTVASIKSGNLDSRAKTTAGGEIKTLESGINNMASSLKKANYEMQKNIEKATEDLRIAIETTKIKNAELELARKAALESSRIKSEFLANMSHEIRTPLNGIIGFTNLISKTALSDRQTDYIRTIQKSSSGLLALINDILDFSKIEAGKLVLDKTLLSVRDIIQDVLTILGPTSQDKNLELIALIYSDVPTHLMGDPLRLKQIITNLVNNAIKFTETGSVTVRCMLEETNSHQAILKISVTDTGIGLSKEQQQALFKAFSQADTSATRQFGGSGLGLAISKSLVIHMEGDIGLESEVGKGSTFWFTVKLDIDTQTIEPATPDRLANKKIAIFENHPTARLALYHQLNEWQIEVKEANSQTSLIHLLHSLKEQGEILDASIIGLSHKDCMNPDTLIFLQEIKTLGAGKLLALINSSDEQVVHLVRTKGVDLCLTKPTCFNRVYEGLCDLIIDNKVFENPAQLPPHSLPLPPSIPLSPQPNPAPKDLPTILAVDDNEANLKLLVTWLSMLNTHVLAAKSGKDALNLFDQHKIDLIFLDIQMPGMSGMEVLHHIRQRELHTNQQTPIVALTAHALGGEKESLLAAGMNDYLTKPATEEQIAQCINKWTHFSQVTSDQNETAANGHLPSHGNSAMENPLDTSENNDNASTSMHEENDLDYHNEEVTVSIKESLKLVSGKPDLAIEMFEMLLKSLEQDQKAINEAFENEEHEQLFELIHRLHGATKYCGTTPLRKVTELIEVMLKKNILHPLKHQLETFNEEVELVIQWSKNNNWKALMKDASKESAPSTI